MKSSPLSKKAKILNFKLTLNTKTEHTESDLANSQNISGFPLKMLIFSYIDSPYEDLS